MSGDIGIDIPNNTNFLIGQNGFVSSNGQSGLGIKLRRQLDGTYITLGNSNGGPTIMLSPNSDGGAGFIDIEAQKTEIKGVVDPTNPGDAANKRYVDTQLSAKLTTPTGTKGQLLGFTADNTVGAVDAPESGLTQDQADERYLQLTGGTLTGEVDMGQNPIRNVSTIFGGTAFAIRSGGSTTVDAFTLNISTSDGTYISGGLTSSSIDATNITVSNVGSGDTAVPNKAYVDSKSPTSVAITLTTSGWSSNTQTVTVSGVSASETAQLITPTPAIASQSAYYEAGIMCTGRAANSLTFTCQTVPKSNLTVYVVIQPLS